MDIFGFICFVWAVAFTVACKNYGFMTWDHLFIWRLYRSWSDWFTQPERWKGIVFTPLLVGIIVPLARSNYSFDEIVNTWIRLFLSGSGIVLGLYVVRFLRAR